jgi:outer membrane protein OmpA-like peptidoglycan-associated protein
MNTTMLNYRMLVAAAALLALGACAAPAAKPDGAVAVRTKLTQLQSDPQLAGRAPVALKDAEAAVRAAETPTDDHELARHRVLMADRKVDIARAQAQTRFAEDQRKTLAEQREAARLESRTREADSARSDARSARADAGVAQRQASAARSDASAAEADASSARSAADLARGEAVVARNQADAARMDTQSARSDTALAQQQSADLQLQLSELNARATDRGFVVTLGDVLFATGGSSLKGGTPGNLNKLAAFLAKYPDRTVVIEGHTDSVGTADSNLGLSQRRADSVKSYLVGQGVESTRVTATGMGEGSPTANNDSVTGRQQNRRVEVIISNTVASLQ